MADDAEWIEVHSERGVIPSFPRRNPNDRPFWASTAPPPGQWPPPGHPDFPTIGRNPPHGGNPHFPPSNPGFPPLNPGFRPTTPDFSPQNPDLPHDSPEVEAPGIHDNNVSAAGIAFPIVGGLMGILIVALLVGFFVVYRRLREHKRSNQRENEIIRVTDVSRLSSSVNDGSNQIYANTSDLHNLVNSDRMYRKNLPPIPTAMNDVHPVLRNDVPPPPVALRPKPNTSEKINEARNSIVNGFQRISERITNNINFPSLWSQNKKNDSHQKSTETVISMPGHVQAGVPEVLDDDDLWSEDSFDSCSIGYEDENFPSRMGSARKSNRSLNRSKRFQKSIGAVKPSVPPPAPPSAAPPQVPVAENVYGNMKPLPPNAPKPVGVVRPAPPVPEIKPIQTNVGFEKPKINTSETVNYAVLAPIPTRNQSNIYSNGNSQNPKTYPPLPSLPKPHKPKLPSSKPAPPSTPKPTAKPNALPKLKMGLSVPHLKSQQTPDTATTLLSATPSLELRNKFYGSSPQNSLDTDNDDDSEIYANAESIQSYNNEPPSEEKSRPDSVVDTSNLSVSARRALLEGKNLVPHNRKQ